MKLTLAALVFALLAASAPPAAAYCDLCINEALTDDSYPPGVRPLPPRIAAVVAARDGRGLSLAGFYNDPSMALARRRYWRR